MANPRYRDAIASIESAGSGDYKAVGPKNSKLGRALGRYQIMEANIGPWSREALGREVSPAEFMAKPEIQDAIFDAKFGGYVDRYGEEGAAQAWFAGPGGVGKTERKDVLGTDVGSYGSKFLKALGAGGGGVTGGGGDTSLLGGGGDVTAADLLRMIGADAPQPEPAPESVLTDQAEGQAQTAAEMLKLFDLSAEPLQGGATELDRIAQPPSIDVNEMQLQPDQGAGGMDITRKAVEPFGDMLRATGQSIMGTGPSVAGQMIPESIPLYREGGAALNIPEGIREGAGRVLDIGLGPVAGMGALYAGGVGAAADLAESLGMSKGSAQRLSRDLTAMPEAFAGTPGAVTGGRGPRIAGAKSSVPARTAQAARRVEPSIAKPAAAARMTAAEESKMRSLIAKAAANNPAARKELAQLSRVNPEAAAAAKRLGMEIPADVFADNAAVQQAAGIVRAVRGNDAAIEWQDTLAAAKTRAAEIMRDKGATLDLSTQSENVRSSLRNSIDTLRTDGGKLFDDVRAEIPTGSRVRPSESTKVVNEIITGLGGTEALTGVERRLFKALTSDEGMTYDRLMREKAQLGRAAFKNQGPYADADTRTATRLYKAISDDQTNFVGSIGNEQAARKLQQGNDLWTQAKALEDNLVAGFGKDGEGSIAAKLTSALTQGSKGDIKNLNTVLGVIPEGLRREALLTGIDAVSQSRSAQGGFGFPEYAKLYRGLRQNEKVFSAVSKELGPDTTNMMRDLYEVSLRMDRAAQNVPRTGASNQALLGESLLSKVLDSTTGQAAKSGIGAIAGQALIPVPGVGAGIGAAAGSSIKIGGKRAQAVGQLFRDEGFQRMAIEAAQKGNVSPANLRAVTKSPAYRKWAKAAQIENPEQWLLNALTAQAAAQTVETQNVR